MSGVPAMPVQIHQTPGFIRTMSKTSLKNVQKQKKKARRTIPRPAQSRIQGNTAGVRTRLKKLAGRARAKKAST
jgi:hypothetical protein